MAEVLKKFGKYFLLDQIAQGGMAEIFRARMASADGGGRLLAIKRIIQSYSRNAEFLTMFKSEIKTTSGFAHPNIIQIYDFGEEDGMLYIAMEYVDGRNLRQLISRFTEMKSAFPVEICIYIMEQAALGMGYAHSYKDKFSGKPLNIVHRDISPQNILISYDGAVKVIDFGIAKAVTNMESTRAGVIKGKPSYLSPEQIAGDVLDGRSDIFALGIVLWELLTGRKLFAGENDFAVLKLIENCTTHVKPPSLFNPKIPKDLDSVVLKCLQKDRNVRYQTAEEMQRALHKCLYQYSSEFNPADLGYYAKDVFKNEIVEDRKKLLKLNERAEQLLALPTPPAAVKGLMPAPPDGETSVSLVKENPTPAPSRPRSGSGGFNVVELNDKAQVTLDFVNQGQRNEIRLRKEGLPEKPLTGSGSLSSPSIGGAGTGTPSAFSTGPMRSMPGKKFQSKEDGKKGKKLSPVAALLAIGFATGGYYYYAMSPDRAPAAVVGATLVIESNVKAATITAGDKTVSTSIPATVKGLPAGTLKVTIQSNGFKKFAEEVVLSAGETKTVYAGLAREDGVSGPGVTALRQPNANQRMVTLKLNISPPGIGTQIRINGSNVDVSGIISVPADIQLNIVVERDSFRTYRRSVTIPSASLAAGNAEFPMNVVLEPAKFGFVSIKTTPSAEAIIAIDGIEETWSTPVSRKRIPVGHYRARLVNRVLGMHKDISFNIDEDRFTNIEERLTVTDGVGRTPGSR